MKIRYYLRGLGLGILFTAVFFMIGGDSKQTMSNEMIKERAKELGMIENTVLVDIGNTAETVSAEEESYENESETVTVLDESAEETIVEETMEEEAEESVEESAAEEVSEEEESEPEVVSKEESSSVEEVKESSDESAAEETSSGGQVISIVVNKGEGSDTVSQRLYDAGLVDDPYAYDKYLMQNGYDRRIGAGEHLIPAGSSWQEIAQILCS